MESEAMSEENARRLMALLREAGCKAGVPIDIAQVQAWAEKNGFSELLEDALDSAGEMGWVDDDEDPTNGQMKITPEGWNNGKV
jgi:hypothetical protein